MMNCNYPPFGNLHNNNFEHNNYSANAYIPKNMSSNFYQNRMNYNNCNNNYNREEIITKKEQEYNSRSSNDMFDLFGIKLATDDLIILALIFFLYNEKVDDIYLFIALILLLLN